MNYEVDATGTSPRLWPADVSNRLSVPPHSGHIGIWTERITAALFTNSNSKKTEPPDFMFDLVSNSISDGVKFRIAQV